MKYIILCLLFFTSVYTEPCNILGDRWPLVAVVIMVKNEESVIRATLEPYVQAGIDAFLVFDTGSTDNTMQKARELFTDYNVAHGSIIQEPFVDFSVSRNRALELCQELFPNTLFMLMPDAEWYIHDVPGLLHYCKLHAYDNPANHSYRIRMKYTQDLYSMEFFKTRLLRPHCGLQYLGVVHEMLNMGTNECVPGEIYFDYNPLTKGIEKTLARAARDKELLLAEHIKNPKDPRTLFFLAKTHDFLREYEPAYKYYMLRTALKGEPEEDYLTWYRLGCITEMLSESNSAYTWQMALHYFLTGYYLRPHRIEPLVMIGRHYILEGNYEMAHFFLCNTLDKPYPADLFDVEKYMYDYLRYELLSVSAWYIGQYEIGMKAVKKALEVHPEYEQLHKNLALYTAQKKS
jgi:glycosyltransferase involved in cell wall biosynthesis